MREDQLKRSCYSRNGYYTDYGWAEEINGEVIEFDSEDEADDYLCSVVNGTGRNMDFLRR